MKRLNDRKKQLTKPRSGWKEELPLWVALRKCITDAWALYIYACNVAQRTLGDVNPKKTEEGVSEKLLASVNASLKRKGRTPYKDNVQAAATVLTTHNSLTLLKRLTEALPANKARQGALEAIRRALKIRNKMLERNLPLVKYNVNRICNNEDCGDLDKDDLVQHGYTGLVVAAERFDPNRGFRFSTFANWWIFQSIRAGVKEEGRTIRLPHSVLTNLRMAHREMSKEINAKGETDLRKTGERLGLRPTETDQIVTARRQTNLTRLDAPVRENGDGGDIGTVGDCIGCAPQHDERIDHETLRKLIRQEIQKLTTANVAPKTARRLQDILLRRFGFQNDEQSLATIGRDYGVSRERVRQLEHKALEQLHRQLHKHRETLTAMGYSFHNPPVPQNTPRKPKKAPARKK